MLTLSAGCWHGWQCRHRSAAPAPPGLMNHPPLAAATLTPVANSVLRIRWAAHLVSFPFSRRSRSNSFYWTGWSLQLSIQASRRIVPAVTKPEAAELALLCGLGVSQALAPHRDRCKQDRLKASRRGLIARQQFPQPSSQLAGPFKDIWQGCFSHGWPMHTCLPSSEFQCICATIVDLGTSTKPKTRRKAN